MNDLTSHELRELVAHLSTRLAEVERQLAVRSAPPPLPPREAAPARDLSRRQLLRRAGLVSAAGAGAALVAGLVDASPAAADDGDPLLAGGTVTADVPTIVTSSGIGLIVNSNGGTVAVQGNNTNPASSKAVGVRGKSNAIGVYGSSGEFSIYDDQPCAVYADSQSNPSVIASTTSGTALLAQTRDGTGLVAGIDGSTNANATITGTTAGTGSAVAATVTNTTSSGSALAATTAGVGSAVRAKVTGASASPSVYATHSGGGPALRGDSSSGLGAQLQGGQAPLRLMPSSRSGRPTSGSHNTGELFVDHHGVLFYCLKGGTPGTWKKVTLS